MRISDWSSDVCSSDLFQSAGAGGSASGTAEVDVTGSGLGDISVGASYRLLRETFRRPDVVLNARVKAPTGEHPFGVELVEIPGTAGNLKVPERLSTGSGVWGASAGISVLKTLDPMVVFRSEEHTSELQSLMRISYAVFCLKKKKKNHTN